MTNLAKTYALVLGIVLALVGILGFVPGITTAATANAPAIFGHQGLLLGIFAVDPLHNVIHLATGLIGIAAGLGAVATARYFALIFGIVYALVTIIGFVQGNTVLGLISINLADNILHVAITVASLAVYFATANSSVMTGNTTVVRNV